MQGCGNLNVNHAEDGFRVEEPVDAENQSGRRLTHSVEDDRHGGWGLHDSAIDWGQIDVLTQQNQFTNVSEDTPVNEDDVVEVRHDVNVYKGAEVVCLSDDDDDEGRVDDSSEDSRDDVSEGEYEDLKSSSSDQEHNMERIREMVRLKVKEKRKERALGKLVCNYSNVDELQGLTKDENIYRVPDSESEDDLKLGMNPVFDEKMNMKLFEIKLHMVFSSRDVFKSALKDWCVRKGVDMIFKKNEPRRVCVECRHASTHGCTWVVHAHPRRKDGPFVVNKLQGEHFCGHRYDNKLVTAKFLGKRIVEPVRDNKKQSLSDLQHKVMRKIQVHCSKRKVRRAKKEAMQVIEGDFVLQYAQLRNYCATVIKFNPGSHCLVNVDYRRGYPVFAEMFFCVSALANAFKAGCRPLISLDGCFLKSKYGGQLLTAVARDGNDNTLPIALAIVSIENKQAWSWFLRMLHNVIGHPKDHGWAYMSDRQKGLLEVFKEEYPNTHHRFCLRHMTANFWRKFPNSKLRDLLWCAARATTKNQFDKCMKKIYEADLKTGDKQTAFEWLSEVPPDCWSKSHFPSYIKCDSIENNISESFNAWMLDLRELPPITLFEKFTTLTMIRNEERRRDMERDTNRTLCASVEATIKELKEVSRGWQCPIGIGDEFEVQNPYAKKVVNLRNRTCTCRMYDLSGIPCEHALAAINTNGLNYEHFVHPCYSRDTYLKVYSYPIHPTPGMDDFVIVDNELLQPPVVSKKTGRPKKKRRRNAMDTMYGGNSSRSGVKKKCSKCGQVGHNKVKCVASNGLGVNASTSGNRNQQHNMQNRNEREFRPAHRNIFDIDGDMSMGANSQANPNTNSNEGVESSTQVNVENSQNTAGVAMHESQTIPACEAPQTTQESDQFGSQVRGGHHMFGTASTHGLSFVDKWLSSTPNEAVQYGVGNSNAGQLNEQSNRARSNAPNPVGAVPNYVRRGKNVVMRGRAYSNWAQGSSTSKGSNHQASGAAGTPTSRRQFGHGEHIGRPPHTG